jgi:RNA polymerase sigma-70 factor (ECF subfamily)
LLDLARRFVGEQDARDAVAVAFREAFAQAATSGRTPLRDWLRVAVLEAVGRTIRARCPASEPALESWLPRFRPDGHLLESAAEWEPATGAAAAGRGALYRHCLERLPEPDRAVLLLRDAESLGAGEVARMLGIAEPSMDQRLHRARLALRALLDPHLRS